MDVIQVIVEVFLIANGMFPVMPLPNTAAAMALIRRGSWPVVAPGCQPTMGKRFFDNSDACRIIAVPFRK